MGGFRGFHNAVKVPGKPAIGAPADVPMGLTLKGSAGFVGPGFCVASDAPTQWRLCEGILLCWPDHLCDSMGQGNDD